MKKITLALILSSFCIASVGSAAFSLDWSGVLASGEKNSNQLKSARKKVESSEWVYRKAFSTFLPQVSASAGMTQNTAATAGATSRTYSYGVSATQYLFRGLDDIYGVRLAYANLEYSKADLAAVKASVLYDIRSAYIDFVVAGENIKLLRGIYSQRKQNTRLISLRYESGREDKGNLLSTRADEAQAEYDLNSAERALNLAKLRLFQLLQDEVTGEAGFLKPAEPKEVDFEQLAKKIPDYIKSQKQLEIAELTRLKSISGFLPSLSLIGNYSKRGSEWPPGTENKSWSLNLSYAFFPGGSNLAESLITSIDLDGAKEDFKLKVKDLRYGLEEAYKNYKDSLESLKVSELSMSANEARAKITTMKYLNGLMDYDEWSRIESTYIQAQKQVLSAKKSALLSEAAWYKTCGGWIK